MAKKQTPANQQRDALSKGWKAIQDLRDQTDVRTGRISRLERFEGRRG